MSTLARLNIVIDTVDARRRLDQLGTAGRKAAQVIGRAFQQMAGRIGGVLRQLTSLKAAFASIGAALIIRNFIQVANTLEQVEFQLNAVTKSQKLTNAILGNTRKFATEVSFSFEDLAESAKLLTPQLKNNVDQVDFFLRAAADVSAVTGLAVTDSASQIARMFNSGAASADLFRERGVLAMMGFEAGASYSVEETRKKMIAAFEEGGSVLAGVAPSMATTLNGVLSMIGDKVFELKATLMDAGVFDFIKDAATVINEELDKNILALGKNATLVGSAITGFLEDAVLFAGGSVDAIKNTTAAFMNFFDGILHYYNQFSTTSGGTVAAFGILGFLVFGAKGGILGVVVSVLYGVSDHILTWFSKTIGSVLEKAGESLRSVGMNYESGQYRGSLSQAINDSGLGDSKSFETLLQTAYADRGGGMLGPYTAEGMRNDQQAGRFSKEFLEILERYMNQAGMVKNAGSNTYTNSQYLNTTPMIGGKITSGVRTFESAAGHFKDSNVTLARPDVEDIINDFLVGTGGSLLEKFGSGSRSTDSTAGADFAAKIIERIQQTRLNRRITGTLEGVLGGSADGSSSSSNSSSSSTVSKAAAKDALKLELTQQYGQKLKELEQQLLSNTITQDQFNFSNDFYKDLIAAGIPLTGQLTAAQEKQKMGILQLNAAQENHRQVMEDLKTTYIDYTNRFSEGWLETVNTAANVAERTKEIGASMYSSLEQGLTTFIKTGRLNFKDFLREMITDYLAAQARMAMAGLFKSVIGMVGGGMGSIAGSFAYGGQSAGGGAVLAGRAYTVGERGRETFVPNTGGRIVPNGEGGGNVSVVQNFDFSNADEAVLARLQGASQEIQNQTFSSVFEAIGQGGTYAKASGRR